MGQSASPSHFNTTGPVDTVTSRGVVGVSAAGVVDKRQVPELAANEVGAAPSVLPAGATLGSPASRVDLNTKTAANDLSPQIERERQINSKPVADYIKHGAFKVGSKLVIRMVPTATGGAKSNEPGTKDLQSIPELIFPYAGLQSVSEMSEEKFQLFEGFGTHRLLMFGTRPKIWTYSVFVMNGARPSADPATYNTGANQIGRLSGPEAWREQNHDFADELYRRYEAYYRGTRAVELGVRCFITYEDRIVEGQLVMLSMPRNSQIPGLISATLTVVVSNDSFTVSGLSDSEDLTIAELLAEEKEIARVATSLSATHIANARMSAEQRLAAYAANQLATDEAQTEAVRATEEAGRAQAAIAVAQRQYDEVSELLVDAEAELVGATSESEAAAARNNITNLKRIQNQIASDQQALAEVAALGPGEIAAFEAATQLSVLEASTVAVERAEANQRSIENNLRFTREGDVTVGVSQGRIYAEQLVTQSDGRRIIVVYDVTDEGGEIPPDLDAREPLETRDVTDNPEYDAVDDSTNVRQSRVFAQ